MLRVYNLIWVLQDTALGPAAAADGWSDVCDIVADAPGVEEATVLNYEGSAGYL